MAQLDLQQVARERFAVADEHLSLMEVVERYATEPPQVIRSLLDAVGPEKPGDTICELGFGTGWLLEEMVREYPDARIVGLDMSPAFVENARQTLGGTVAIVRGDMQRLPFADATLEVVVTCWTLYFMPDIDATLVEIKRALRPGGRIVAATNATDHMQEYDQMAAEAYRAVTGREDYDPTRRFMLDSGRPYMERHFADVRLIEQHGEMALPDPPLALRFWDQWRNRDLSEDEIPLVRAEFVRLANAAFARDGAVRFRRHSGAFVGRKPAIS
jgi:SAM-dependent methyltransferase